MIERDCQCPCGGLRLTEHGVCLGCGSLPVVEADDDGEADGVGVWGHELGGEGG